MEELTQIVIRAYGVADAELTGSGTEALTVALESAERLRGSPTTVVLPAFSCFDVAAAAVRFGRRVRFYDIDPDTLGPDPDSLRAALVCDAPTVVLASLYGVPIDWHTVDPIVNEEGAIVVEDAAQGQGAAWHGRRLGGHGRLGLLSFGRGKGWTGGAGGALLIRDACDVDIALAHELQPPQSDTGILVRTLAHWALGRPGIYGLPRALPGLGLGETHYREVAAPSAMSPRAAALAMETRMAAEASVQGRRRAAARYVEALAPLPGVRTIATPDGGTPGYIRFPVVLPEGLRSFTDPAGATRLGAALTYPRILPELEPIRALMYKPASESGGCWPGAKRLVAELVTLPTHGFVSVRDGDELISLLEASRT